MIRFIRRLARRAQNTATAIPEESLADALANVRSELDHAISDATDALAQAINSQRSAQAQLETAWRDVAKGDDRVLLARARSAHALARSAEQGQKFARADVARLAPIVTERTARVEQLKDGLADLRHQRAALEDRSADMLARDAIAHAQEAIASARGSLNLDDVERTLRQREALAGAKLELTEDPFDALLRESHS